MAWFAVNLWSLFLATIADLGLHFIWHSQFSDRVSRGYLQNLKAHPYWHLGLTAIKAYGIGLLVYSLPGESLYSVFWLAVVLWGVMNISGRLKRGIELQKRTQNQQYLLDLVSILLIGWIFVLI